MHQKSTKSRNSKRSAGNLRVGLIAGRVYFDAWITQIILEVDCIGPQRKKSVEFS